MSILVTGGAGYIGSFMVKRLLEDGHDVLVADSLEKGHKEAVDEKAILLEGDLRSSDFVKDLFDKNKIDAVIHFAAYISMGESMKEPGKYFDNNVSPVRLILDQMQEKGVSHFIFSSTAGVYGNPTHIPITEDHPKKPTNPYGESKLMVEQMLKWYQKIHGIHYASLRYFNASGASIDGKLGEIHDPETHIIPSIINAALSNTQFTLFGDNYKTEDGSCVRDYIHVLDLVEAHILALHKIQRDKGGYFYNVGTGKGYSNKEVIEKVKEISGKDVAIIVADRRPGDADILVADPSKIKNELQFDPRHSDLTTIVTTAWNFHNNSQR